jgi:hypothetical protein
MIDWQLRVSSVEIAEALYPTGPSPLARKLRFRPETSGLSRISLLRLNVSGIYDIKLNLLDRLTVSVICSSWIEHSFHQGSLDRVGPCRGREPVEHCLI